MERRVIIIISIVVFIFVSSAVTEAVRFLDTLSPDECSKELCLTLKTDKEVYDLQDPLKVDVFLSNNGVKDYHGLPSELDMDIYNASQALMISRSTSVFGGRRFILVRGTKTELNPPLTTYLSTQTFHPGIFTIIVRCRYQEYVLEGNITFTIRD